MLYTERKNWSQKLVTNAALEGQDIMVVGSGVWFEGLERALVRALEGEHIAHVAVSQMAPLFRASFKSGGSIQCIDLASGENMHMIDQRKSRVPQVIYLVEDAHGVHASIWTERIKPFLQGTACRVVYLGSKDVNEPSED